MKRICVTMMTVVLVGMLGCGEEKVNPNTLPEVVLESRAKERPRGGGAPTFEVMTFRLGNLDRYDWSGKMLRVQLLVGDAAPEWSLDGIDEPGSEVMLTVRIGKEAKGNKIVIAPQWGRVTGGRMTDAKPILFNDGEQSGKTVIFPGSDDYYIANLLVTFAPPNRPGPFDPDQGIDLFTVKTVVKEKEDVPLKMRLRVFASGGTGGS